MSAQLQSEPGDEVPWKLLFLVVTPGIVALAVFATYVVRPEMSEEGRARLAEAEQAAQQLTEARDALKARLVQAEEALKISRQDRDDQTEGASPPRVGPTQAPPRPERESADLSYTVLRKWHPNNDPNGVGVDILLKGRVTERGAMELARQLSRGKDPAIVRGFLTLAAYREENTNTFTAEYDRGYLFFFVKNGTSRGPYQGFNEIRWMQAEGALKHLFGQKTRL